MPLRTQLWGHFLSDLSLQSIMNDMAAGTIAPPSSLAAQKPHLPQEPLTEIDAFMAQDTLLAHLHKEFLNAQSEHAQLLKANGADDAMTDVAADMMDSAWCAMQTRLMELRRDGVMMRRVQDMMAASKRDIAEAAFKVEQKRSMEFFETMQMMQKMQRIEQKRTREKERVPFFEIAFIFLMFKLLPAGLDNQSNQFTHKAMA